MLTNTKKNLYDADVQRQDFYLTKRTLNSGKRMYYYYFYDKFGNRTVPKTTGKTKKQDAFQVCVDLLKHNNLDNNRMKFKTYTFGFFDKDSSWYKTKSLNKEISENTLKGYQSYFKYHIYEYFGEMLINKINTTTIREFRVYLAEEKELSPKTINNIIDCLRTIFNWAEEEGVIFKNPISRNLKPLDTDSKRDAFTLDEVKFILGSKWQDYDAWLYCTTAAFTGLRFSEIAGLKKRDVHETYINVTGQYLNGKIEPTKTRVNRFVSIPKKLSELLIKRCASKTDEDLIFFRQEDFDKPIPRTKVIRSLYSMYSEEMKAKKSDRILTFHSLRHFCNTFLISHNIQSQKVDFMIGHSPGVGAMQALYTSWQPDMFSDVLKIQENLFNQILARFDNHFS